MSTRAGLLAVLCITLASAGCIGHEHRVNTVPWWKGLPCMVAAPSSLEAHVWRQHLHSRHGDDLPDETAQCMCAHCTGVEYEENFVPLEE